MDTKFLIYSCKFARLTGLDRQHLTVVLELEPFARRSTINGRSIDDVGFPENPIDRRYRRLCACCTIAVPWIRVLGQPMVHLFYGGQFGG